MPAEMTPVAGAVPDYLSTDQAMGTEDADSGLSISQLINERRAQSESPEYLRLARAL